MRRLPRIYRGSCRTAWQPAVVAMAAADVEEVTKVERAASMAVAQVAGMGAAAVLAASVAARAHPAVEARVACMDSEAAASEVAGSRVASRPAKRTKLPP